MEFHSGIPLEKKEVFSEIWNDLNDGKPNFDLKKWNLEFFCGIPTIFYTIFMIYMKKWNFFS